MTEDQTDDGFASDELGAIDGIDTSVAHPARVYDYWLGGKDNFAADREAAERVLAATPGLRFRVQANRAFLARAVRYLAGEAGIRQFLDIGTGIPAANNTHEVAQSVAPDSRVVYVDNDPIVLVHARALLASSPQGSTQYVEGDLRDSGPILNAAAATLDFAQPVALMLLGIMHLISDSEEPYRIVAALMERAAVGQLPRAVPSRHRHQPRSGRGAATLQRTRLDPADAAYQRRGRQVLRRARASAARSELRARLAA